LQATASISATRGSANSTVFFMFRFSCEFPRA
jgi:hypothetical protein